MRLAGFVLAFAAGTIASIVLVSHAPLSLAVDRAQPLVVATNWHAFGFAVWTLLAGMLGTAYVAYARVLRKPPGIALTCFTAACAFSVAQFFVPLFSSDLYAYAAYGQMAHLGIDPYRPSALPAHDPILTAAAWQWQPSIPKCVYGPAFVALSTGIVNATRGSGILAVLQAFRLLSLLALLGCSAALAFLARVRNLDPRSTVAYVVLHPVAIWSAIEGHNDTLMALLALCGLAIALRRRAAGACIVAAAALVKLPALGAALALAIQSVVAHNRARETLAGVVAGTVVFAICSRHWLSGALGHTGTAATYLPQASVQGLASILAAAAGEPARVPVTIVLSACVILALVARAIGRFQSDEPIDGWTLLACAAWVAIPNPYPWYAIWLLPLAAFASPASRNAVGLLALASLVRYIPDAAGNLSYAANAAASVVAAAPVALLVVGSGSFGVRYRFVAEEHG